MKLKIFRLLYLVILVVLFSYPGDNYAASKYRELITPKGKIIIGLSRDDAIKQYGYPASVKDDIWYYSKPHDLFIYLPPVTFIRLYPENCNTVVGSPLELWALAELPGYQLADVTKDVEFIVSGPEEFIFKKAGILIPRVAGDYQVIARYNNIYSNPSYINVKKTLSGTTIKDLVRIDVLPFKPILAVNDWINPLAFGTFMDSSGKYSIKNLSMNVKWSCEENKCIIDHQNNLIRFSEPGTIKIFCMYGNLKSLTQEINVIKRYSSPRFHSIKNIAILPEFIPTNQNQRITVRSFGTYDDNSVEEITQKVSWSIKDKEVLESQGNGFFLAKSVGITNIVAGFDGLESLPVKVIVDKKREEAKAKLKDKDTFSKKPDEQKTFNQDKPEPENLLDNIVKISRGAAPNKNKNVLSEIKIIPEYLEIALGESAQFDAFGIYNDGARESLTLAGNWIYSAGKTIYISKGKVTAFYKGETDIFVEYKGVKSLPAKLIVKEPKLLSIIVSPDNLRLSLNTKSKISAEGYFTDESRQDITSLVKWGVSKPGIVRIEKGNVIPRFFGQTQIYAEHLNVKSLPIYVSVIFSLGWIIAVIWNAIIFSIIIAIISFITLYFINLKRINRLVSLQNSDAREFIINIYKNSRDVLGLFGLKYDKFMSARFYALLVEQKKLIDNGSYFNFTLGFEEAAYSKHIIEPADAQSALNNYCESIESLFNKLGKSEGYLIYLRSLIWRVPILSKKPE